MTIRYEGNDQRPAYTLEFLTPDFDGRTRLLVADIPIAEGDVATCIGELGGLIDTFEPFTIKVQNRGSFIVKRRTPEERAAGASAIIRKLA